jgi:leader peptidase (prepilin peptidase)/N-methyltransferase
VYAVIEYVLMATLLGAVAGSFLNVVAYRVPRHESIVSPPSRCTTCGTSVKPYDNVPMLSWLMLRGHCRACRTPISPRYPLVEAATALLCVGVVLERHSLNGVVLGLLLVLVLVPVALIDFDYHIIPNRITAPAAVLAVVLGSVLDWHGEPERLIAGAAAGGFFLLAALCYPRGMGMGDVKLAGLLGLLLGRAVAPAIFTALIVGVIVGVAMVARSSPGKRRQAGLPFGPFLAIGGLVGLYAGNAIVAAYLQHLS